MTGYRHDLMFGSAAIGEAGGRGLSEPMRGAMWKIGFVAAFTEPVAKAVRCKGPIELSDQESQIAARALFDDTEQNGM